MERLNITLDEEQALKLARLAERLHLQPGTRRTGSLLSSAIDDADPASAQYRRASGMASRVPFERAQLGLEQARIGETVSLDDL